MTRKGTAVHSKGARILLVFGMVTIMLVGPSGAARALNEWVCFNQPDAGYTDVSTTSPHRADINCLKNYDLTTQEGTFRPLDPVTRVEMALFLTRVLTHHLLPVEGLDQPFTDTLALPQDMQLAISQLFELGITTGITPTTYEPATSVPRWQMALFLARVVFAATAVLPAPTPQGFGDLAGLSQEAVDAINQLRQLGIAAGTGPTTFDPLAPVTREQMASFVVRTYVHIFVLPIDGFVRELGTCNTEGTVCSALIPFPANLGIGLRAGLNAPYPFATPEDQAQFHAADTVVYITVDDIPAGVTEREIITGQLIVRWYYAELTTGLSSGNHTIEFQYLVDGIVVQHSILTLQIP